MLEKEYKCIIDEETYNRIKGKYKWNHVFEQTNHYYFDVSGELTGKNVTVRVREKDGTKKLQIKKHRKNADALQICEESEFDIDSVPEVIENGEKFVGEKTGRLVNIGALTTLRNSCMWNETTEICLDKSDYAGCTDYEIEVEYTGEAPTVLVEELKRYGALFAGKPLGKYSRFLRKLKEK